MNIQLMITVQMINMLKSVSGPIKAHTVQEAPVPRMVMQTAFVMGISELLACQCICSQ